MDAHYLESTKKQFEYYKLLGEKAIAQLEEPDLFWKYNEASNSIAIIVKHLWGNMLSRWTDFLTSDGEKDWRNRDGEFESTIKSEEELLAKWNEGWECVFKALDSINRDNFSSIIYIRNIGHTIPEAITRQLAHYALHVGQIVYIARMIKSEEWESLTIPIGKSKEFNSKMFAQPKHKGHFTDAFIEGHRKKG